MTRRVLVVDLNNFARYPSVPVGYLVSACREAGMKVTVFSPLSIGVKGVVREAPTPFWGLAAAKLNYLAATSRNRLAVGLRNLLAARRAPALAREKARVVAAFEQALAKETPDVVLISTYLMYRELVGELTASCQQRGVRVIVGGPYFSQPEVIREWVSVPGLTALASGELENVIANIVEAAMSDADLAEFPGLWVRGTNGAARGAPCPPLRDLDASPCPDYTDFPWEAYPNRIVPVVSGRGCSWGACTFCSDVTSGAGRTFRSRSPARVLDEIAHQHEVIGARLFVFTDLKLNGDLAMWRGLLHGFQKAVPGGRWIALVHVQAGRESGLSRQELDLAAASGCVRLSTGLESGSQRMLDLMRKGASIKETGRFLVDATAAGISTRCTMIMGYPGEEAEDVCATTDFLREHVGVVERVMLNRFQLVTGSWLHRAAEQDPSVLRGGKITGSNNFMAQVEHSYPPASRRPHRTATMRLLEVAHEINRRPLRPGSREFDGVM